MNPNLSSPCHIEYILLEDSPQRTQLRNLYNSCQVVNTKTKPGAEVAVVLTTTTNIFWVWVVSSPEKRYRMFRKGTEGSDEEGTIHKLRNLPYEDRLVS